jgi:hypothetical protein
MDKFFKHKLTEVEFIDPIPEKDFKPKGSEFDGVLYVDDERIPKSFLEKIEKRFGPIPKGSYFTGNFSMYWEKLDPDYGGEVNTGTRSVSTQYRLPNFSKIFRNFTEMRDDIKFIQKNKEVADDPKFAAIFQKLNDVFNEYRTHLRKEYPAEYEIIQRTDGLKGELGGGLDEMSTTGGGAGAAGFETGKGMQYATPYAFNPNKKADGTDDDIMTKEFGYKLVREEKEVEYYPETFIDIATSYMKKHYGGSRIGKMNNKQLEVLGQKIVDRKYKGDARKAYKDMVNEGVGADLGPGPKAGKDGVEKSSYVTNYGYKLVPKKIKGSGLEVKQLFEDDEEQEGSIEDYQKKRIGAFDSIEQEMNDIYKMLSNARNETSNFYSDNPGSYAVVKPTDLVLDYIKDIKDLLKQK